MKRSICSLLVISALSGVTLSANASNDWEAGAKDAWIDGKAETTLLLNGNLNSFDINTDVQNGKVILTGKVESKVDKALAEELVADLDGVTSVVNELTVVNEDEDNDSEMMVTLKDAKVETVVKTKLLMESEVSGTDIEVEVNQGVVTLSGTVDSDAELDLAEAIAKNTTDVTEVVNNLKLAPSKVS
ncbi:BON domain-containing protein [Flavobacterium sp. W21_SRS_FM6]|uniref:BON domain-containing protein n=1 Tax=Flavobacterium sp. W21_SRS_FM6 TaxID=3240268 RepID=UPI003F8F491F